MKRVLIYSHDTFGLGNIRRMLEVARHLVESSSEVSVLVVTGSPMLHAFRIPPRVDYLKLPCLARDTGGHYGARFLDLSLASTVKLRANLIRSAVADFLPDLILVDKKPFGVEDELCAAFESLPSGQRRPRLVLLLRDILDSPESTAKIWRRNGYFDAVSTWYDQVLVVGSAHVFDLKREYDFPPLAGAKLRYCGYIARPPGRRTRTAVREDLGVGSDEALVLVTPGGGEDGYSLLQAMLAGLASLTPDTRPRTHIVCGPELAEDEFSAVQSQAACLHSVSVQRFSDDMMSLMGACDVAVSMGGYNTVCELLTLRRRAVVVPRSRPGLEQLIRAQRMAGLGLLRVVDPQPLAPASLMRALLDALLEELQAHSRGEVRIHLNAMQGLDNVSQSLLELLDLDTHVLSKGRAVSTEPMGVLPTPGFASFVSKEKSWQAPISLAAAASAC
ncbi:MAG: glycosyltransferase [Burkholderiaceae bacterium]